MLGHLCMLVRVKMRRLGTSALPMIITCGGLSSPASSIQLQEHHIQPSGMTGHCKSAVCVTLANQPWVLGRLSTRFSNIVTNNKENRYIAELVGRWWSPCDEGSVRFSTSIMDGDIPTRRRLFEAFPSTFLTSYQRQKLTKSGPLSSVAERNHSRACLHLHILECHNLLLIEPELNVRVNLCDARLHHYQVQETSVSPGDQRSRTRPEYNQVSSFHWLNRCQCLRAWTSWRIRGVIPFSAGEIKGNHRGEKWNT